VEGAGDGVERQLVRVRQPQAEKNVCRTLKYKSQPTQNNKPSQECISKKGKGRGVELVVKGFSVMAVFFL
jgi:hypothetical protein